MQAVPGSSGRERLDQVLRPWRRVLDPLESQAPAMKVEQFVDQAVSQPVDRRPGHVFLDDEEAPVGFNRVLTGDGPVRFIV